MGLQDYGSSSSRSNTITNDDHDHDHETTRPQPTTATTYYDSVIATTPRRTTDHEYSISAP